MAEPIFMKLGMYIMAPQPITMAYFINPSHQFVCLYMHPLILARKRLGKNPPSVARQWLGKNDIAATNRPTRATTEKLLDAWFSMLSMSYQGK
jgi:hypothetical protein